MKDRTLMSCLTAFAVMTGLLSYGARSVSAQNHVIVRDLVAIDETPESTPEPERFHAYDEKFATIAIQGIVNRRGPLLYVIRSIRDYHKNYDHGAADRFWLDFVRRPGQWLDNCPLAQAQTTEELLAAFPDDIKGVVLWDGSLPATGMVASTLAGVLDAIPVRFDPAPGSLYHRLVVQRRMTVLEALIKPDGSRLFTGKEKSPGPTSTPPNR